MTRSLGLRTDMMTIAWDGVLDTLDDGAILARTPANPDFYFGNFLLFPDAPAPGEPAAWKRRFEETFADDPRIRHCTLRWDRPDGARGAIEELEGFVLEETVVLATEAPHPPPKRFDDATLRRIETDADWDAVCALQTATTIEQWGEASGASAAYARDATARNRRFVAEGRGAWFGAFVDGVLAADMGVFVDRGLGRYQSVETAAAYRRRGICGSLVFHAAQVARSELGADTLVLVGLDDHTAQIYASCGFDRRERLVAALRRP